MARGALDDGSALAKFAEWVAAQGGDPAIVEDTSLLPRGPVTRRVAASGPGFVVGFDAEGIGRSAMLLGAGRATTDDVIDPGAGLTLAVRVGDYVDAGDTLCTMYASREELFDEAEQRFSASVRLGDVRVPPPPLFHEL
jgi:thymidine phosphorylase